VGKVAFLFAGQGAQHEGMGRALAASEPAAAAVFATCDAARPGTSAQCFEGSAEELNQTQNTQPCMWATDLAAGRALAAHGVVPQAVAGFSLGELAALAFAGVLTDEDAFAVVCRRCELMAEACAANPGGMTAVVKLSPQTVEELAAAAGAWPVNYNSPAQTVCAGTPEALEALAAQVKEAGGRAMPLKVSGAFHSPLMEPAAQGLAQVLENVAFAPAGVPVWANATAEPYPDQACAARALLARQVASPVRWSQTLCALAEQGFDTFIELGPGKVLTGLVKRTLPDARGFSVETPEDLAAVLEALEA
jgi:[acyl-carrier-protein] S-malonyltransferase